MESDFWPGRKELERRLMATSPTPGKAWLVTCTKPTRLIDQPTVTVYVDTQLTRVPAKQQAETKALDQLRALGVRNPEVVESRPAGDGG